MAQKVHIVLEDDLDGSPATETVSFGLDGKSYEIDLSDDNAAKLRDSLAVFVRSVVVLPGPCTDRGGLLTGLRPRPHRQDRRRRLPSRPLIQTQRGGRSGAPPSSYVRWEHGVAPHSASCTKRRSTLATDRVQG